MNLSYKSIINIVGPILIEYISNTENDKDRIFTRAEIKKTYEENGYFYLCEVSALFSEISDKLREIEDAKNSLDYYIEFMDTIFRTILHAFKEKYEIDDERFNKKLIYYLESELKK